MPKITHQKHDKQTITYAGSRLLERIAFYGIRSIIIFYLIKSSFQFSDEQAFQIYGWFFGALLFAEILGALVGDFLWGNKQSLMIGGIMQAIGAFILCIPYTPALYLGLGLILLGTGIYSPNQIAYFGKLYLNRTKLLDSAFSILYLAANFGAFLGVVLITYIGETFGWTTGFALSGAFFIISIIFPLLVGETISIQAISQEKTHKVKYIPIFIAILVGSIFLTLSQFQTMGSFNIEANIWKNLAIETPQNLLSSAKSIFLIIISIICITRWTFFYRNQFTRMIIGFVLGLISLVMVLSISVIPNINSLIIYIASIAFMSLAEFHIRPVVQSVITQYANPKYLTTILSLAFVPTRGLIVLLGLFHESLQGNFSLWLMGSILIFGVMGLLIFFYTRKLNTKLT